MIPTERIELRAVVNDLGVVSIVDQDGRKVRGVRNISLSASFDDITTIALDVISYVDGDPIINKSTKIDTSTPQPHHSAV